LNKDSIRAMLFSFLRSRSDTRKVSNTIKTCATILTKNCQCIVHSLDLCKTDMSQFYTTSECNAVVWMACEMRERVETLFLTSQLRKGSILICLLIEQQPIILQRLMISEFASWHLLIVRLQKCYLGLKGVGLGINLF